MFHKKKEHNQKEAMASKSALNIHATQSFVFSLISLHRFVLFDSKLPKVLSPLDSILEHAKIIHIWECFRSFLIMISQNEKLNFLRSDSPTCKGTRRIWLHIF